MNKKEKIIISEEDKQKIINIFENYHNLIEDKVNRFEELISSGSTDMNSWIKSKNKKSCVLENQAIAIAEDEKLQEIINKIRIVEDTLNYYKNGTKINDIIRYKIIKYKFIDKPIDIKRIKDIDIILKLNLEGYEQIDKAFYSKLKSQIIKGAYKYCNELEIMIE